MAKRRPSAVTSATSVVPTLTTARPRASSSSSRATGTQPASASGHIAPEAYHRPGVGADERPVLAERVDPVARPLEVRLHAGEVAPAVRVLVAENPGKPALDRRGGGRVVAEDAAHHHRGAHGVHRVVDVLLVPRAVGRLPAPQAGEPAAAGVADAGYALAEDQVGDERILDQVRGDLDTRGMEVGVVPASLGGLALEDERKAAAPGALDLRAAVALAEGEHDVEEAHGVARRVEVGPPRVDPAAVVLLGGKEVVDRPAHGGGERAVLLAEVAEGPRVQQHAQRVRDQLEILRPRGEAPSGPLLDQEPVLLADRRLDPRRVHHRASAQARR